MLVSFPMVRLMRSLRVREYKLEREESTTSFLIFLSHPPWALAPDDSLPILHRPSTTDKTLPHGKHSCHGSRFMLLFVRSDDIYRHRHLTPGWI